jgi:hypothetical protein
MRLGAAALTLTFTLTALVAMLAMGARSEPPRAKLELTLDAPAAGTVLGDKLGMAFVAGKALAHYGQYQTFDIMFVVDTSQSTDQPSGADVDSDGKIGQYRGEGKLGAVARTLGKLLPFPITDQSDSVLAAEIAAVETMLEQLDPRTTRVGLVTFAGDADPMHPDSVTHVPLTADYEKVRRGLRQVLDDGPAGQTNMMSGVRLGTAELLGTQSAHSEPRESARRIMVFLTDGTPTLPLEASHNENARMAISQARKAAKAGIRIDTYAIGELALSEPVVAVEMAAVTQGVFTPVRNPRDLRAIFEEVSFADIAELRIENHTTRRGAEYQIQNADGSFSALVPLREGENLLEVYARSSEGTEARRRVTVRYLPGEQAQLLDPALIAQRNRLLENRLQALQRRSVELEVARDQEIRKELRIEIERERREAVERSGPRRKELEVEVEREE